MTERQDDKLDSAVSVGQPAHLGEARNLGDAEPWALPAVAGLPTPGRAGAHIPPRNETVHPRKPVYEEAPPLRGDVRGRERKRWLEVARSEGVVREERRPALGGTRAGVRTPIVALKPGNAGGAKGRREKDS